jgi:hypothetical protein
MVLDLRETLHIVFLFQYGRENIEIAKKERHVSRDNSEGEDEDEDEDDDSGKGQESKKANNSTNVSSHPVSSANHMLQKPDRKLKNGVLGNSSTSLISREDLILVPDPEQNYTSANNTLNSEGDHAAVAHVSNRLPQRIFLIARLAMLTVLSLAVKILFFWICCHSKC